MTCGGFWLAALNFDQAGPPKSTWHVALYGWSIFFTRGTIWLVVEFLPSTLSTTKAERGDLLTLSRNRNPSNAWRGTAETAGMLRQGISMAIRDGRDTRFWLDNWVDTKPLVDFASTETLEERHPRYAITGISVSYTHLTLPTKRIV